MTILLLYHNTLSQSINNISIIYSHLYVPTFTDVSKKVRCTMISIIRATFRWKKVYMARSLGDAYLFIRLCYWISFFAFVAKKFSCSTRNSRIMSFRPLSFLQSEVEKIVKDFQIKTVELPNYLMVRHTSIRSKCFRYDS